MTAGVITTRNMTPRRLRCQVEQHSVRTGNFFVILSVICFSSSYGTSSMVAVIASTVFTALMMTGYSYVLLIILYTDGFEVRHRSEILPYLTLQTIFRKLFTKNRIGFTNNFSLSRVIAPDSEHPVPVPGTADGTPYYPATPVLFRLHALHLYRAAILTGSHSSNCISSGRPPTLWCAFTPSDSRISG